MTAWACCDPNGATYCVGCGDDIKHGRPLPRVAPQPKSKAATTITLDPPVAFINANDRPHYQVKAKLTKAWREAAAAAITSGFHPDHYDRARIVVNYRFPNNRRREVANLQPTSKAIVDGLVDARLIPDDDDTHVIGPDNRREYPNGTPRVTVTITPIGDPE